MMNNDESNEIVFLTLIAGRKDTDAILSALAESGVPITNSMYGKGTVNAGYVQNVLGFIHEVNKVVITGPMRRRRADAVLSMLLEKFRFNEPNTGIAFITPIEKISF